MQIMATKNEREAFEAFCTATGVARFEDFDASDKVESPDILSKDGKLGIEVVSYHRDAQDANSSGSPLRASEARLKRLVEEARASYVNNYKDRADVYFFPHPRAHQATLVIPPGAAEIVARIVADRLAGSLAAIPAPLAPIIEEMSVGPTQPYQGEPEWGIAETAWAEVDLDAVQTILDSKDHLIDEYRRRAPEIWLLIYSSPRPYVGPVADDGRWSTFGSITSEFSALRCRSRFDHVYYFDMDQERCVQVHVGGGRTSR